MAKVDDNVFPKVILGMQTTNPAAPSDASWKTFSKADGVYARSSNTVVGPFASATSSSALPFAVKVDTSGNHHITTTSFAAVDTTNLRVSLTTTGASGSVLVTFMAPGAANGGTQLYLSLQVDTGGAVGGTEGIMGTLSASYVPMVCQWVFTGLSAGAHTFDVLARVGSSSGDLVLGTSSRGVLTALQVV